MEDKKFYIDHIVDLSAEQIVKGIRDKVVTFDELRRRSDGDFIHDKQKRVKDILAKYAKEDEAFNNADSIEELKEFLKTYPNSQYAARVEQKITQKENEKKKYLDDKIKNIKENINDYTVDELIEYFDDKTIRTLCKEIGIEYNIVKKYNEPQLRFNIIPENDNDIPTGYTDVFFWGIPTSGKTCALSAIFKTIQDKYTMEAPNIEKKFGATYKDSLVNIFQDNIGYLPAATQKDKTQYIPFLLKKRDEKYYRQVSFFELSGEVFKYFYDITNNSCTLEDDDREQVQDAFRTLDLLLKSTNQKIHFFFIDYNRETKDSRDSLNLTQGNYLDAAATYFRDKNDIFKRKTDAVYIVVTKADEIKSENRVEFAKKFLSDNFGSFMDTIKSRCEKDFVKFNVTTFSIGDVYFKRICKLNYVYAENIVKELLKNIKPYKKNKFRELLNR